MSARLKLSLFISLLLHCLFLVGFHYFADSGVETFSSQSTGTTVEVIGLAGAAEPKQENIKTETKSSSRNKEEDSIQEESKAEPRPEESNFNPEDKTQKSTETSSNSNLSEESEPAEETASEKEKKAEENNNRTQSSKNDTSSQADSSPGGEKETEAGGLKEKKSTYLETIVKKIRESLVYPRSAQRRNQQGTSKITVRIDPTGRLSLIDLAASSGYTSLDRQALQAVEKSAPFPPPLEKLASDKLTLTVPVSFKLQ